MLIGRTVAWSRPSTRTPSCDAPARASCCSAALRSASLMKRSSLRELAARAAPTRGLLDLLEAVVALALLARCCRPRLMPCSATCAHALLEARAARFGAERPLRDLPTRLAHALDAARSRLHRVVAEAQRLDEVLLADLVALALDHHDRVARGGDDEVESLCFASARRSGWRSNLPSTRPTRTPAIGPAHGIGQMCSARRRADHAEHVRRVLLVDRQHGRDDLHLVAVAVGEERPARAVDQARGEDLVVAQAAFALEEAARDLARGVGLLDVVDAEREEVDAGPRLAACRTR